MTPIKLSYYKSNVGVFLKAPLALHGFENSEGHIRKEGIRLNGKVLEAACRNGFLILEGVRSLDSWEVMSSPGLKGFVPRDDVPSEVRKSLKDFYAPEEEDSEEFQKLQSLYKRVLHTEGEWLKREIEHVVLGELTLENFHIPEKVTVRVHGQDDNYLLGNRGTKDVDLSTILNYSQLDKIVVPEFMLHTRPCKLTGDQVYSIIRAHVLENIDGKVARVTSNYDFVFKVERIVRIKPHTTRREILTSGGKSYAKPRFQETTVSEKKVPLFSMTNPKHRYGNNPVIRGWEAPNLEEMKNQIWHYLEVLMEEINREVAECEHCGGTGHICTPLDVSALRAQ